MERDAAACRDCPHNKLSRTLSGITEPNAAVSIIDEVDFELELIQRDEINVAYILALLSQIAQDQNSQDPETQEARNQKLKLVLDLLGSDVKLRSKRELIEQFNCQPQY